jgi:trans-aconitate 2-methyltransferase
LNARLVVDLGCGPGNSTELLIARYPDAEIIGVDSSPDMLRRARHRLQNHNFIQADLWSWNVPTGVDLFFSSGVLQWVPGHQALLQRLIQAMSEGGVLAAQIPDITFPRSHSCARWRPTEGGKTIRP